MSTDVSRRAFVGTVAAAAAAPVLAGMAAPAAAAPAPAGKTLILGVASYSLRKFTLDQVLEAAKGLGVTHMTFKDVHIPRTDPPETTRALRAKIEAAGVTIMGGGTITMENKPGSDPQGLRLREERRDAAHLLLARSGGARLHRVDGQGARHQVRHPQPRP